MNVVLFHRDLRLHDHLPLHEAIQIGPVFPLYIVEPSFWKQCEMSVRHFQFVLESLSDLKLQIEARGGKLFVFIGELEEALAELLQNFGVFRLFYYEEKKRHERIKRWMTHHALPVSSFPKECQFPHCESERRFKKKWKEYMGEERFPTPHEFPKIKQSPKAFYTELDELYSFHVKGEKVRFGLEGGEQNAMDTLHAFLQKEVEVESRETIMEAIRHAHTLSPYITWGNVSLRFVVQTVQEARNETRQKRFQKFVDALLERSKIAAFHDAPLLKKQHNEDQWFEGKTGIPILDANIRYLKKTGWIDHRSREAIVSMLKALNIDEEEIEQQLAKLWIDYDPVIHHYYVKNTSKVLHPITYSKKVDPEGEFIKRNIPELKQVPPQYIHEPWRYPGFFHLQYPAPVIDIYKVYRNKNRPLKVHEEQLTFDI